jgi:DNA/RNA endonuclease YhcR with UshA esterase domain
MNYVAQDNGDGTFNIYMVGDTTDVLGNPVTKLVNTISIDGLQSQIDDLQAKLDAITACQGGVDTQTQYSNNMAKQGKVVA